MTRKPDPLPDASAVFIMPDGRPHPDFLRWLRDADRAVKATIDFIDTPVPPPPDHQFQLIEEFSVFVRYPEETSYEVALDAAMDREIYEVVTKCATGTCTVTIKTDGTPLGGPANNASTTQHITTHSTNNVWNTDEDLVAAISSNSGCESLTITVKTRRTITSSPVP